MKDMGIVQGSEAQAKPLVVGKDTVYVHTDIEAVETDKQGEPVEGLYSYHEIQYGKDEYIKLLAERNENLETETTNIQMALCEVYELMQ